jgi:hypothetical protein
VSKLVVETGIDREIIRKDVLDMRRIYNAVAAAENRILDSWLPRAAGGRPAKGGAR